MISVIVPVYNTGDYIKKCIQSICNQTYFDLQIIVIDDGSEKNTAEICDELAREDIRIEVIHKKNEGVSRARNVGLEMARGDIICFVDSDDTILPEMLERMANAIMDYGTDIAMCDATTIIPGKLGQPDTIPDYSESCVINISEIDPATLTRLAGSAWRCAYRTDTLVKARARFPEGIKFSEDRVFNLMAMGVANKIFYIKEPFYNRLIRPGSACFRFYPDIVEQIVAWRRVLLNTLATYWNEDYVQVYERQVCNHILFSITNFTASYSHLTVKEQLDAIQNLCKNLDVQASLHAAKASDFRSRLILQERTHILLIVGKVTNVIHKICRKIQFQS